MNIFRGTSLLLTLFFASLPCAQSSSAPLSEASPCPMGKSEVLKLADYLFGDGDYERAAVEYLRFYLVYPDDSCAQYALFMAALSKERAGEYTAARKLYERLGEKYPALSRIAEYRKALTYFYVGQYDTIIAHPDTVDPAMRYLLGWANLAKNDYKRASEIFSSFLDKSDTTTISGSISFLLQRCRQGLAMHDKNPYFAALISALAPGLGRGYAGHWGDALFGFITVAVPAGLSASYWKKDRGFAVVMAVTGIVFYFGDIYGSFVGAKIANKKRKTELFMKTIEQVPHPPGSIYSKVPCKRSGR